MAKEFDDYASESGVVPGQVFEVSEHSEKLSVPTALVEKLKYYGCFEMPGRQIQRFWAADVVVCATGQYVLYEAVVDTSQRVEGIELRKQAIFWPKLSLLGCCVIWRPFLRNAETQWAEEECLF